MGTWSDRAAARRRRLARDGYVVLRAAVGRRLVEDALRAVNAWIDDRHDCAHRDSYRARTYAPELVCAPTVTRLLTDSGVREGVEGLVGGPLRGGDVAQVALGFPSPDGASEEVAAPHIDGVATPGNGLAPGRLHGFTVLVGVMLSDVSRPGHGNLLVWPGAHLAVADLLHRHGDLVADGPALLERVAEVAAQRSRPVAVLAGPGDVVVAHYLLPHTVGPHGGPHIRYAVYFRLASEGGGAPLSPSPHPW